MSGNLSLPKEKVSKTLFEPCSFEAVCFRGGYLCMGLGLCAVRLGDRIVMAAMIQTESYSDHVLHMPACRLAHLCSHHR